MPVLLASHADRERKKRKDRERKAYDQTTRKLSPMLARAKTFRSSRVWQRTRELYLLHFPVCADPYGAHECLIQVAQQVDHIKPLEAGGARTDWGNLQGLCTTCHAKKSQGERR